MKKISQWACAAIALASVGVADIATACVHPESGQGGIRAEAQEYTVVHARGRQVLLISTQLAPSAGAQPQALSLVTATPSLPDVYQTGDPALFDDLHGWFNQSLSNGPSRGDVDGPGGVDVLPRVEAGPYGITPIMASGPEGVTALNDWLSENGFEPVDRMLAQPYVDRGWYFLAVDVQPAAAGEGLGEGRLPPLHLEFASTEVVVPLKLEAGMGPFAVRIYLFLQGSLPDGVAAQYGLETGTAGSVESRPESVTTLLAAAAEATGADAMAFEAYELHSDGPLNTAESSLAGWEQDFAFRAPDEDRAPPMEGAGGMAEGTGGMAEGTGGMPSGTGGATGDGGEMSAGTGGSSSVSSPGTEEDGDDGGCATNGGAPESPWIWLTILLFGLRRRR